MGHKELFTTKVPANMVSLPNAYH